MNIYKKNHNRPFSTQLDYMLRFHRIAKKITVNLHVKSSELNWKYTNYWVYVHRNVVESALAVESDAHWFSKQDSSQFIFVGLPLAGFDHYCHGLFFNHCRGGSLYSPPPPPPAAPKGPAAGLPACPPSRKGPETAAGGSFPVDQLALCLGLPACGRSFSRQTTMLASFGLFAGGGSPPSSITILRTDSVTRAAISA
jgi:hypothetical protein